MLLKCQTIITEFLQNRPVRYGQDIEGNAETAAYSPPVRQGIIPDVKPEEPRIRIQGHSASKPIV